jgi:hypothetical protein
LYLKTNNKLLKMKKQLLLLLALAMFSRLPLNAQTFNRCGTMEYLAAQKAADPGLEARMAEIENQTQKWVAEHANERTSAVVTIPVVFHVVYNTSAQNISDAQCQYQLQQLNADYSHTNSDAGNAPSVFLSLAANTQIQFCLAQRDPSGNPTSGIIHKSTTASSFSSNNNVKHNANGGDDAWDRNSYLNIWICNLGGGLLGYAQFPGGTASTDGVVVHYGSVGSIAHPSSYNWSGANYNYGRSCTHEVGHWLNLIHIWGDSNCGNDQVADTPTQQTSNFGCPSFPHVTCSNGPNGDMFMNYMDYTDDNCMNLFSAGQTSRITSTINGTRVSLKTSLGCTPVTGGCNPPTGLNASSITTTAATLGWSAAAGANSYNIQYRQTGTGTWTSTTSATTSKAISGLTPSTQYEFQVQSVCSGGAGNFSASSNFTTSAGSCVDNYEANNTAATATPITLSTDFHALISPTGDVDFFKFSNTAAQPNIKVTLTGVPADYDLKLVKGGVTLASSTNGGLTNETIIYNTSVKGNYKIKVYGNGGANNATVCYTVRAEISAAPFRLSENEIATTSVSDHNLFIFPNPVKDVMNLQFNNSFAQGNIEIKIIDMLGRTIISTSRTISKENNTFEISMKDLNKGIYFVEVTNGTEREVNKIIVSK